ncbi:hypothetical protein PR001_g29613 [Phytophthora rubi]|uniref:RxLR effector protein n=1 Tax=Phytophthora rubi TaxID=129364 RepID=A0A6A3H0M4_9STRA|nr:hypothetical protein PR001_g29613 [Phytophthora rubi]
MVLVVVFLVFFVFCPTCTAEDSSKERKKVIWCWFFPTITNTCKRLINLETN